jgi:hypothetical protein
MYKRLLAVALVAAGVAFAVVLTHTKGASAESSPQPQAEVAPTQAEVQSDAYQAAAKAGDPSPSSIEETHGTMGNAAHALDPNDEAPSATDPRTGQSWSQSSVYVVTMHGQFTLNAPTPKNGQAPQGTDLTILIDGKSNQLVGVALNDSAPNLHEVGPTVTSFGG